MFSLDEEIIEAMEGNKKTDDIETIEEEEPKPIDEDKPDMTSNDKIELLKEGQCYTLLISDYVNITEVEKYQNMNISRNEQIQELQSVLELESLQECKSNLIKNLKLYLYFLTKCLSLSIQYSAILCTKPVKLMSIKPLSFCTQCFF